MFISLGGLSTPNVGGEMAIERRNGRFGHASLRPHQSGIGSNPMEDNGWKQLDTLRLILASIVAVGHAVGIFAHPFAAVSPQIIDALSQASEVRSDYFS